MRIWALLKRHQKTLRDIVLEVEDHLGIEEITYLACEKLQISRPIVLSSHQRDWQSFWLVRFSKDLFVEAHSFEFLEIQALISRSSSKDET